MQVGGLRIDPVHDGSARFRAVDAYPKTPESGWEPHKQFLTEDGMIQLDLGGFLVRGAGDRVVLVDAGIGSMNRGPFEGGKLLESLGALGVTADDITDVVFTHLHFDHVGWATRQGEIVFPNATYRCDVRDWSHFVGPDPGATKKLTPLEPRLETWDGERTIAPGIDVRSAPGHTPGSTIVVLSSGTDRALLLGDVVHCPVELLDDEWDGLGDVDPDLAKRTRNALAREMEGQDVPMAAAHFPGMEFGRLLSAQGRRQWVVP